VSGPLCSPGTWLRAEAQLGAAPPWALCSGALGQGVPDAAGGHFLEEIECIQITTAYS